MVELDKFLPVNREEAFRNGVNKNFAKIEQGFSQRDAVMNSHRTTQKNAHNSKQIKHVLWDVEQELKYRAAQVGNLVIGANGDGIAETKDARVAVFSKKAHATLSERLLEDFLKLENDISELEEYIADLDTVDLERTPTLTSSLDSTLPLQSFVKTERNIIGVRLEPVKTGIVDDYRLLKFSFAGDRYASMKIIGGGHLENIGYKDGWFYSPIWDKTGKKSKVIAFKYENERVISYDTSDSDTLKSFNVDFPSQKVNINVFKNTINLMFWISATKGVRVRQYTLSEFIKGNYNIKRDVTIATDNTNLNWIQGCVATDDLAYISTGAYAYGEDKELTIYDLNTSNKTKAISLNLLGADDVDGKPLNNWNEPEGLGITVNNDGTYNLHIGVFTGGSADASLLATNKRFKIYTWAPASNPQALQNDLALAQASLATKERLLFFGDVRGDSKEVYELSDKVFNYKQLAFYYTTGAIGTHSLIIPTDRFNFADYVDLQNINISSDGVLYNYVLRIKFDSSFKRFTIAHSRGAEIHLSKPNFAGSGGTYDNHAGIHLYHIRGYALTTKPQG